MKKKSSFYLEAMIGNLPRSLGPAFTSWLFRQGCWGTQENLTFSQNSLKYPPKILAKKFINVSAFFPVSIKETMENSLSRWMSEHSPMTSLRWVVQPDQDWLNEWKKHFKAFELSGLHFVPCWLYSKKYSLKKSVLIEPGMAFGTGTHATTQFAIGMLKWLSTERKLKGKSLLDVGAGSGILSVVAERFGFGAVTAIDNDPESWRECSKMFALNKTKICKVTKKQLGELKGKYDVVVANIIDGVLIDLKKDLWRRSKLGGHLILSGILTDGASAFIKSFTKNQNARVILQLSDSEWTTFLVENGP